MLSRKKEDYLEVIYNLVQKKGYARIKDIANALNVKSPSASEMLEKLQAEGLVSHKKYDCATLTSEGARIAKSVRQRHEIFETFLKIIYVSDKTAEKDACTLEHHLASETIRQFSKFVLFIKGFKGTPRFFEHFRRFCKTGKLPKCVKKR